MPGRWGCPVCGTVYGDRLFGGCPRHPGTPLEEQEGDGMAKITVSGGPSNELAEEGQPGYTAPEEEKPARRPGRTAKPDPAKQEAKPDEGGEPPSRGSSSQTSTPTPPSAPKTNDDEAPSPAPTTANPSERDPEASGSTARSTGGAKTGRSGR